VAPRRGTGLGRCHARHRRRVGPSARLGIRRERHGSDRCSGSHARSRSKSLRHRSRYFGFEIQAEFHVSSASPCHDHGEVWIAREATASTTSVWALQAAVQDGGWQTVRYPVLVAGAPAQGWFGPIDATHIVDDQSGKPRITLRLTSTAPNAASTDLLQVVHRVPKKPDIDRDGSVGSADLSQLLGSRSQF